MRGIGGDVESEGCGDGLAVACSLDALEFVEGAEKAAFDVGLVAVEFAKHIVGLNLAGGGLAEGDRVDVMFGRCQRRAKDCVHGILC